MDITKKTWRAAAWAPLVTSVGCILIFPAFLGLVFLDSGITPGSRHGGVVFILVLTAWGRSDRLEAFDEARITSFIAVYRGIDHHK